jgi:hypothetical protein
MAELSCKARMDPSVKRLAVEMEAHDLGCAEFEGVIGEGYYGAGPVLVWDTGWFEPLRANRGPASPMMIFHEGKLDQTIPRSRVCTYLSW